MQTLTGSLSPRFPREQLRSYLEEHPQQAVPVDFSADYLNMAINLMLAQAQECFCEKVQLLLCFSRVAVQPLNNCVVMVVRRPRTTSALW